MWIVSLISRPGALDKVLVSTLQGAFGGGIATWLAPDEAAEFAVSHLPANFEEVRLSLADQVDLNILPAENRRKKMLLADMDSTIIEQECIDELAAEAGIGEQVREITARAMNGELDFEEALRARVALLEGQPETIMQKVMRERITFMPGGKALLNKMRADGAYLALVSGGFTAFTADVAKQLGFDEHRANSLLVREGRLTGQVAMPILGREAKVQALMEITSRLGLTASDVLAVGDGANDLGMLGRAGMGVALHAKPVVQTECALRINHGTLTALLYLQGIAAD